MVWRYLPAFQNLKRKNQRNLQTNRCKSGFTVFTSKSTNGKCRTRICEQNALVVCVSHPFSHPLCVYVSNRIWTCFAQEANKWNWVTIDQEKDNTEFTILMQSRTEILPKKKNKNKNDDDNNSRRACAVNISDDMWQWKCDCMCASKHKRQ